MRVLCVLLLLLEVAAGLQCGSVTLQPCHTATIDYSAANEYMVQYLSGIAILAINCISLADNKLVACCVSLSLNLTA